jgi:putative PEP-CTERM system histidine kinase
MLLSFLSKVALASSLISFGVAAYVLYQNPGKTENISFAAGMTMLSLIAFGHFMDYHSLTPEIWKNMAFAGQIFLPVPWLVFSIVFARTDHANHLRKWRAGIGGVSFISLVFLGIFLYTCFGNSDLATLETVRYWAAIFLMLTLTLILSNFEWTMRSGERQQRWRIKFLVFGIASIFFFMIFNFSYLLLFPATDYDLSFIIPTVIFIGTVLAALSFVRHSLLGVDIGVSRDIVKSSFIVMLVGAYLFSVGLAAQAIRTFGGEFGMYLRIMLVFLALVFIGLVLLSTHVRKTARMFVDRHFFSSKFDYGKEWLRLTNSLSSKLDVYDIASSLANFFAETFWINTTLLWLVDDREDAFRVVYPGNSQLAEPIQGNPAFFRLLEERDRPVLLDDLRESPDLPEYGGEHIALLKERGVSLLVPLMLETKLVGVLGLSKSRYGVAFDTEDLALIYTIASQAASSLLSAQLAKRIAQSKELETFHLFSTFIIHDLKNFVSMLSLLVQNMEKKFSDPAFQKDAVASVSQTVEKMKFMMERLSVLSAAPVPCKTQTDMNELLREVMGEMKNTLQSRVVEGYGELPPIWVDPEQMVSVIKNLVKNADEATSNGGVIRLDTEVKDGKVLVSVSDNGSGIPKEYMDGELFTLFSSTKSDGFGIGLYQAKRIVESHGGTIEAESEVGKGSTFRLCLPVDRK